MSPQLAPSQHEQIHALIPRVDDNFGISPLALRRVFQGVAVAAKTTDDVSRRLVQWLSDATRVAQDGTATAPNPSVRQWLDWIESDLVHRDYEACRLASLAVAIAFLREKSRCPSGTAATTPPDLELAWSLIYRALNGPRLDRFRFSASRSAQGFLAVPLCSLIEGGRIDELFRLHVWLPDSQRGNSDFAIHSHQPFAQSWILAGEGKNYSYEVEPATEPSIATHAEYELSWNDGRNSGSAYKTHQTESVIVNTGRLVRASATNSTVHSREMSYVIPHTSFHSSQVAPDTLHATLFFFDSSRGFNQNAPVLGPPSGKLWTQLRDPTGITVAYLVSTVEAVRSWEMFMTQGQGYAQRSDLEHALRAFSNALNICETASDFPNVTRYRHIVLGVIGNVYRRFGRYKQAKEVLEKTIREMSPSLRRVELSGELGVVFRLMNLLGDAQRAFEFQYDTAKQLDAKIEICRAIGNLGMVNFQLYQQNGDKKLLKVAIEQLNERIEMARHIMRSINDSGEDPKSKAHLLQRAVIWETIGLSRLSLCYTSLNDKKMAIAKSLESVENAYKTEDGNLIAISQFFYGRALLRNGQHQEALKQFNPPNVCTPAMAFCREPSDEHREYLQELIDAGADLDLVDDQGYMALDYAVFNGDMATATVIINGIRRYLDGPDVEQQLQLRLDEAKLRKGYRELFQEKLRPVLLSGGQDGVQRLRREYAKALASDEDKRNTFDRLKFLSYSNFCHFGRILRSSEPSVRRLLSDFSEHDAITGPADFMIFMSYRWINRAPGATSPDDAENTQYQRMLQAVDEFLKLHPSVDKAGLGIWVDFTCVDQDRPMLGVSALPMIVAQCDALISLVDDMYYTRAWCSVEVMMVRTLKKSYNMHLWYEHVATEQLSDADQGNGGAKWILREGPTDLEIDMAEKHLSLEEDRPKVLFLERQTKLLG